MYSSEGSSRACMKGKEATELIIMARNENYDGKWNTFTNNDSIPWYESYNSYKPNGVMKRLKYEIHIYTKFMNNDGVHIPWNK